VAIVSLNAIKKRRGEDLFAPVTCQLQAGEGLGIVGRNGTGKTSLLDIIAGLERPTAGSVSVNGSIGYVMQHGGFQESLSFSDNLLLEAYLSGLRGKQARQQVQLVAARLEILPFMKKVFSKGSSGMRARCAIAAALLSSPQILLLDEVFAFLDEDSREQARHVLYAEKERGAAIVMVSHDREDFSGICEHILALPKAEVTLC